jgi:asparagine synthase (glutamine-hydrolysing)
MCGIGGVFVFGPANASQQGVERMGDIMRPRGPDHGHQYADTRITLLHRRLSILDLRECGNCPMPNEDGSVQVLLNGEIYNWREIRTDLESTGHRFRSQADSEVVTHGYEEWGDNIFARLRGMFAIAIWDANKERLVLARDRLGEKPLFTHSDNERLVFASSLEAIRAYDQRLHTIDTDAVACYLAHSFIPASHTIWKGAEVFPKAHYCVVSPDGVTHFERYWDFPKQLPQRVRAEKAEHDFASVLEDSVGRCLDADVPVGVLLSGGVDSSLIAALATRHSPRMPTYSIGFREDRWNELPFARKVARHIGAEHFEQVLEQGDVLRVLPFLVEQYGQPFGDASAIATHMVSLLARQQVKVCLSGDGADESFAGYWRPQAGLIAHWYSRVLPHFVRADVIPRVALRLGARGRRLYALNSLSLGGSKRSYSNSQTWFERQNEISSSSLRETPSHDRVRCRLASSERPDHTTVLQGLLFDDFQVQLSDDYLTKVDVASMAASLEIRAPFLDFRVVETAWLLPDRMKIRLGERKWLLKRLAARLVPPEVIYRKKMGFALPLDAWFRADLGQLLEILFRDSIAVSQGWINGPRVLEELRRHRETNHDRSTRLWILLWLELWFRVVATKQMDSNTDLRQLL